MPPPPTGSWGAPGPGPGFWNGSADARGRPLAQWWQRLVAIIIDLVILGIPKLVIAAVLVDVAAGNGFISTSAGLSALLIGVLFAVVDIGYFAFMNGSGSSQTVGQIALGIAVRDATTGDPIDQKRAAKRILVLDPSLALGWVPVLSLLTGLYTVVSALSPLWNPRRQGLHDLATNTYVVQVR